MNMIREDLKLSEKLLNLYSNINYYERYEKLSNDYSTDEQTLEKTDKKIIISTLNDLGYTANYKARESFYQITEELEGKKFYFHISLKYGLVELTFGKLRSQKEKDANIEIIGGTISHVCKLIEINSNQLTEGYIKKPKFKTYGELENILKEALSLYEDLKKGVIEFI